MNFELSDEQRMLQDSVQRLLAQEQDKDRLWAHFAELGLLGLPFDEADGGLGGGAVDTFIVMQALGRALAPVPYFACIVLCGGLLQAAATPAQRAALVPALAAGERKLAFAHTEQDARFDLAAVRATATRAGDGWVLDGDKRFVLAGDEAHQFIVSAATAEGVGLFQVDADAPGVQRRSYLAQDRSRCADIRFRGVALQPQARLGAGDAMPAIERAVDRAIAALCAEALGAMDQALALTVDYLKVRRQFGVAIGSFQALQHRAVDMLVAAEQARSMALYATMMSDAEPAQRQHAISAAKVQVNQSGRFVGQEAVQLHGGIGMTEECRVGHYLRRLSMIEMQFGDTAHHLRRLVA